MWGNGGHETWLEGAGQWEEGEGAPAPFRVSGG